jgi:hypothetical protein
MIGAGDYASPSRVWVEPVHIAESADSQRLGLPGTLLGTPEESEPGMEARTVNHPAPAVFRVEPETASSGIVDRWIHRVGGWFSVPQGPSSLGARVVASRPGASDGPNPNLSTITVTPGAPTYAPSYESYLSEYR